MIRYLKYSVYACAIFGVIWLINGLDFVTQYVENGEIATLEARFTPEQIIQVHAKEILGHNKQRSFKNVVVKYHPYLLMEVKYPQPNSQSREGLLLWSMVDGEMVINTDNWEKTHGFEDALIANANFNDFKILKALARNEGTMTMQQLQKALKLESNILAPLIEQARAKQLIFQKNHQLFLHFQNPKILVAPETKMNEGIVTKAYSNARRIGKRFSASQIKKITQAAFGHGFMIRESKEIFLPTYSIETVNPDGSVLTTVWNALTGKKMLRSF